MIFFKRYEQIIKAANRILYVLLLLIAILSIFFTQTQMKNYEFISKSEIIASSDLVKTRIESFFQSAILCDKLIAFNWNASNDFYDEALIHEPLFRKLVSLYPEIDNLYFGDETGNFFMCNESKDNQVNSKIIVPSKGNIQTTWRYFDKNQLVSQTKTFGEDLDPRDRPWYKKVLSPGLNFINPYEFYTSEDQGLTFSRQLIIDERVYGNFGIDITIDDIDQFLSSINRKENYFTYLSLKRGIKYQISCQMSSG